MLIATSILRERGCLGMGHVDNNRRPALSSWRRPEFGDLAGCQAVGVGRGLTACSCATIAGVEPPHCA